MTSGYYYNKNNNNNYYYYYYYYYCYYYYYYIIISILTYSKQIAIYKLKVEKRTIKTYLQFISIKKRLFSSTIF